VSARLKRLHDVKLVKRRREARHIYYSLSDFIGQRIVEGLERQANCEERVSQRATRRGRADACTACRRCLDECRKPPNWVLRRSASVPVTGVRSLLDWANTTVAPPISDIANRTVPKTFLIVEFLRLLIPSLAGFVVAVGLRAGLRSYPPAAAKPAPCGLQALLCASSVFVRSAGHDPSPFARATS